MEEKAHRYLLVEVYELSGEDSQDALDRRDPYACPDESVWLDAADETSMHALEALIKSAPGNH